MRRGRAGERNDAGYVALVTAIMMPVFLMLCAYAVDEARWYVAAEQQQKAADAAALAGVTYIPQDWASAKSTVLSIAKQNGYDPVTMSSVTIRICAAGNSYSSDGTNVSAACQALNLKPSQLQVTVKNVIPNFFAAMFGFKTQGITRAGTADFNSTAPMGSPCNSFGNMPQSPSGNFALSVVPPATCAINNGFWANIFGPKAAKQQGDQYATQYCYATDDGCNTSTNPATNTDYNPNGYYYLLRVQPGLSGPISVDVYDPEFAYTGDLCAGTPSYAYSKSNMNQFAPDSTTRYAPSAVNSPNSTTNPTYCNGDNWGTNMTGGGNQAISTTFQLLNPTDTGDPTQATPVSGCTPQTYGTWDLSKDTSTNGWLSQYKTVGVPASGLKPSVTGSNSNYDATLAQYFHQWVNQCTFNVTASTNIRDYYVHVTTTGGNGLNRFALRATASNPSLVSIAGWQNMSIYANANNGGASTPTFNVIRVLPGAAGNDIVIKLFDIGDDQDDPANSIGVLPPLDPQHGPTAATCTGTGPYPVPSTCTITGVNSTQSNGKLQTIVVHVPTDYTCDYADPGGCWWRIAMNFPKGGQDTTTWSAQIDGDPVRLTQ